ncbi:hypothetical protein C2E23DRAFT_513014 [Lenzites betulinus]|nr:hypothetical protein C2E23DRAFT_513014 [Lenzites betulinus]
MNESCFAPQRSVITATTRLALRWPTRLITRSWSLTSSSCSTVCGARTLPSKHCGPRCSAWRPCTSRSCSRVAAVCPSKPALRVAESFRAKSEHLLVSACGTPEGCHNDAALAAAVTIALIDVSPAHHSASCARDDRERVRVSPQIFTCGRRWQKSLGFAKKLVRTRDGPGLLLARSKGRRPNTVTGVSRARLLLEIVAVYELFGNGF